MLTALVLLAAFPAPATARDSQAPPGAGDRWLPAEGWVMFHWLPYDERELFRVLRLPRERVLAWMRDDQHHRLAQLLRRRGLDPRRTATRLVRWADREPAARRHLLAARALRTLTQGHLSQHVLFHYFHQPAIGFRARSLFGVSPLHYQWLRLTGVAPAQIGALHGRSPASLARHAMRTLRRYALTGARRGVMPYSQARLWLAQERRHLSHWLGSRISKPGVGADGFHPRAHPTGWALMCRLFRGNQRGVAQTG